MNAKERQKNSKRTAKEQQKNSNLCCSFVVLLLFLYLSYLLSFYITDPGMGDVPSGSYLNLLTLLGTVPLSVLVADIHPYIYTD